MTEQQFVSDVIAMQMRHYDALPKPLREVIADAPVPIDSVALGMQYRQLRRRGVPMNVMVRTLRQSLDRIASVHQKQHTGA